MNHRRYGVASAITLAAVLVTVLAACGRSESDDVVATYDGGEITRPEFDGFVETLDPKRLRTDASIPAEEGLKELLREYATNVILAHEGWDPVIEAEPILYMNPKNAFLVAYYRQRVGKQSHEVTEAEARQAYDDLLESRFTLPEKIRFQHIFLRSDRHSAAELRSLERRIIREFEAGTPFADLVASYSESGSKANLGVVGPVFRGRLEESFEDQLFRIPFDQRPHILRTDRGSHVVIVLERQDRHVLPFEEVRPQVISGIIAKRDEAARDELFETLRQRHGVVDNTDDDSLGADDVVLTVAERSITRADLDHFLEANAPYGAAHQNVNDQARRTMVENMIRHNLMYLDAVDRGLDQEPNFVDRWRQHQQAARAATALEERLDRWAESLDDEIVLAYFRQHESRFAVPQRLDISYLFIPYGGSSPFDKMLRIEDLRDIAAQRGFDSQTLAEACADAGAICANPGFVTLREMGRIGPKFQRAALAVNEGDVSEPVKDEHGLFVVAVHSVDERRAMKPPEDMDLIRDRYLQLEHSRIMSDIRNRLLEEHHFEIVAPLTGNESGGAG